ncbi:PBECR4 domain-containing protein [Clostridium perfringens]|nr:PBECR4 domain-containing protein [Clostridium perfringens]
MEEVISFKTRVKNVAINESKLYESVFVNYEYLICSKAFEKQKFYTINAKEENYMHLIGVNSSLSALNFFYKCSDGILNEDDFNFKKRNNTSEASVKGSVRRKISVLHNMMEMFSGKIDIWTEESFKKNNVVCNLATSDEKCTLGFANTSKAYPKTLQKGNELKKHKMKKVDLILRKKNDDKKFNEIIIGDINNVIEYFDDIKDLIDESLITQNKQEMQKEIAYTSIKRIDFFE